MPLGDVWGNSWGDSWNSYWKTATTPPVVVTPEQPSGMAEPAKRKPGRRILRDKKTGQQYLEPILVGQKEEPPTDRLMTAAELLEMKDLLLVAEKKAKAQRDDEELLMLLMMAA